MTPTTEELINRLRSYKTFSKSTAKFHTLPVSLLEDIATRLDSFERLIDFQAKALEQAINNAMITVEFGDNLRSATNHWIGGTPELLQAVDAYRFGHLRQRQQEEGK